MWPATICNKLCPSTSYTHKKHNHKIFFFHIELNAPPTSLKFMGSTFSCHVDLYMEGEKINIYPRMAVRDTRKKRLRFKNILNVTWDSFLIIFVRKYLRRSCHVCRLSNFTSRLRNLELLWQWKRWNAYGIIFLKCLFMYIKVICHKLKHEESFLKEILLIKRLIVWAV